MNTQNPDLSKIGLPEDLPAPRSTSAPQAPVAGPQTIVQGVPNPRHRGQHAASVADSERLLSSPPPSQGSIMPREQFETLEQTSMTPHQAPQQPLPQSNFAPQQSAPVVSSPQAPVGVPPAQLRNIRELFTIGRVAQTIVVHGFELRMNSLTADEHTRAWTLAAAYPEGIAREGAVMQYLLAFSLTHINNNPVESFCRDVSIHDVAMRRAFVFANLDRNLVTAFFNEGYYAVNKSSQDALKTLADTKAMDTAGFFQTTQR